MKSRTNVMEQVLQLTHLSYACEDSYKAYEASSRYRYVRAK